MKKILIFMLVLLFKQSFLYATQQSPDKLHYNDKEYSIYTYPLESHPGVEKFRYSMPPPTNCYRNYTAEWIVKDKKLYWIRMKDGVEVNAQWFTGKISIPIGNAINQRGRYYSVNDRYKFFHISEGVVKNEEVVTEADYSELRESVSSLDNKLEACRVDIKDNGTKAYDLEQQRRKIRQEKRRLETRLNSERKLQNMLNPDKYLPIDSDLEVQTMLLGDKNDMEDLSSRIRDLEGILVNINEKIKTENASEKYKRKQYWNLQNEHEALKKKYNELYGLFPKKE